MIGFTGDMGDRGIEPPPPLPSLWLKSIPNFASASGFKTHDLKIYKIVREYLNLKTSIFQLRFFKN